MFDRIPKGRWGPLMNEADYLAEVDAAIAADDADRFDVASLRRFDIRPVDIALVGNWQDEALNLQTHFGLAEDSDVFGNRID